MAFYLKDKRFILLKDSIKQAFDAYKPQLAVLVVVGFLSGLFEGIGINAIIPAFSFVAGEAGQADDLITKMLKKLFSGFSVDFSFTNLIIFIVVLFIFKGVASVWATYIKIKITSEYERQTRSRLFAKTLRANWPHLLREKVGYLSTVLVTDIQNGSLLLKYVSSIILASTSLIIYVIVAINISVSITLLTLVVGALAFLISKPLLFRNRTAGREWSRVNKEVAHFVNENIIGIKTIKSMIVSSPVVATGNRFFKKLQELNILSNLLTTITTAMMEQFELLFIVVLLIFWYRNAGFSFVAFIAIVYLVQKIFAYFQKIQSNLHKIHYGFPFLQSVLRYERTVEENQERRSGSRPFAFQRSLEFKGVHFSYTDKTEILTDLNFSITKGTMVALIGSSGAGKTTIVDHLLRLLEPTQGSILLDGVDVQKIKLHDWRKKIGYVSQDIFLVNDSIENNIKFYDDSISESELRDAARMANIDHFIESLPDQYQTQAGERGVRLSAGQRQRIVIARVLARKPEFLLLDEATSALDNQSEREVQKVIEGLKGSMTILVIAHRLSTVQSCNELFVLDGGNIREHGTPRALLKDKESYFYKAYNIRK